MAYTGLNQVAKVTEALAGAEKKVTSYTYDANGQSETVTHPDQFSKYTYDLREQVKTVSVGKTAADASPKVSSYTYTDRGQKLQETKANKNTVDSTYYLNGALKSTTEKKGSGTLVSSHTYAYDANGNKAQDVAKKMNADNHAAYLESTTDYTYDPADRLAKSVKTGTGAGTDTYVHDDNANVISQSVKGVSTTFGYDRNRLLTANSTGSAANYNYDPFGRQESVTAGGKVIERSVYDGFDHIVESQKADDTGALKTTKYTFDPLDRTASKTADGRTTDFNYLGMSGEVLGEEVAGELTKSYQYSPWGERLSQVTHNSDGTSEDGFYGYNSHTDVETLTDKDGDTKSTYGYTAYGSDDKDEFTGIDKPEAADPTKEAYNPYRFNAKRWDAQSGTYDMGFRDYSPGLNRFTSRDMYNGALSDMSLGSDPYTGNRYAFTGGNPVSFVELDGHIFGCGVCDDVIDKVGDVLSGGAKKAKGGWLGVVDTFLTGIGWYNQTASNGYETDPGAQPDYDKGLLVRPSEEKEWTGGASRFPFQEQDCGDNRQSMIYYMPLDDAGRAQGAIGCLNWHDTNNVDKGTGEIYGDGGIFGSGTVWPTDDPLYIPRAMQEGGPLYRRAGTRSPDRQPVRRHRSGHPKPGADLRRREPGDDGEGGGRGGRADQQRTHRLLSGHGALPQCHRSVAGPLRHNLEQFERRRRLGAGLQQTIKSIE